MEHFEYFFAELTKHYMRTHANILIYRLHFGLNNIWTDGPWLAEHMNVSSKWICANNINKK